MKRRPWLSLSLALAAMSQVLGCANPGKPSAAAPDARTTDALRRASEDHVTLEAQLAGAPEEKISRCRLTDGDCLISVAERRQTLVRSAYLTQCTHTDPENLGRCVIRELEHQQKSSELANYYELENWCFRALVRCAVQ